MKILADGVVPGAALPHHITLLVSRVTISFTSIHIRLGRHCNGISIAMIIQPKR